jgi:hypothetical protein
MQLLAAGASITKLTMLSATCAPPASKPRAFVQRLPTYWYT